MHLIKLKELQNFNYEHDKPLESTSRRHICLQCSKSYIHAWHLKRHIKFECGKEPRIQCPYCSAKMKQRGHVYRHIRQCHQGRMVYVIDLNWGFVETRKATMIRRYQCFEPFMLALVRRFLLGHLVSPIDTILKQLSYITLRYFSSLLSWLFISFICFSGSRQNKTFYLNYLTIFVWNIILWLYLYDYIFVWNTFYMVFK